MCFHTFLFFLHSSTLHNLIWKDPVCKRHSLIYISDQHSFRPFAILFCTYPSSSITSRTLCLVPSEICSSFPSIPAHFVNYIPYFSRSTLPFITSTPSARRSSACTFSPPNANAPANSPFALTTRKHGICSGSGFL